MSLRGCAYLRSAAQGDVCGNNVQLVRWELPSVQTNTHQTTEVLTGDEKEVLFLFAPADKIY